MIFTFSEPLEIYMCRDFRVGLNIFLRKLKPSQRRFRIPNIIHSNFTQGIQKSLACKAYPTILYFLFFCFITGDTQTSITHLLSSPPTIRYSYANFIQIQASLCSFKNGSTTRRECNRITVNDAYTIQRDKAKEISTIIRTKELNLHFSQDFKNQSSK